MAEIKIPLQLKIGYFRFLLIKNKNKTPIENSWQSLNNYAYNDEKLLNHINNGGNYGIIGGFGKLVVIDADSEEINNIAKTLPDTFTVKSGSKELYKHHYYYYVKNEIKGIRLTKDKVGDIGDIRSIGQYVVAPNSIHPSLNKYRVVNDIPLKTIDEKILYDKFKNYVNKDNYKEEIEYKINTTKRNNEYIDKCLLPDYVLNNKLKQGCSKNWELFPLIVDILYNRGVSEVVYKKIAQTQKHNYGAIKGWVEYAKSGKLKKSNCEITREYIKKYLPELTEKLCSKCEVYKNNNSENKIFIVDSYIDNVEKFYERQPFFYDNVGIFWFWDNELSCYNIVDEIDLMNRLDVLLKLYGQTIQPKIKNNYIEAFKRIGRLKLPKEPNKEWVQFKDKVYDIKTNQVFSSTPDYFFSNPIPWEIGESDNTPIIDELITSWVDKKWVNTLYEIIAYCCYRDYPIHTVFALCGAGRNGKSKFQGLIGRFIGLNNICSTELDLLMDNRFESFKLYKKLICSLGETNFNMLNKTSLLKKLCGQDLIGYEKKNKDPFDDYNYAKIIINSNSLPSSDDTSEGFYRRWMIVNFPNVFPEGKDILDKIPEQEYNNLAKKIIKILPELIKKGKFTNQGTIIERKERYIMASNPIPYFIEKYCYQDVYQYIRYSEFYTKYIGFLKNNNKRIVSKKEFTQILENEMYEIRRTTKDNQNDRYVIGLGFKSDVPIKDTIIEESVKNDSCDRCAEILTQKNAVIRVSEIGVTSVTSVTKSKIDVLDCIYSQISEEKKQSEVMITDIQKLSPVVTDELIEIIKSKGLYFEPRPGYIQKL